MPQGIVFTEKDFGTKRKAREACKRVVKKLDRKFKEAARAYWMKVWMDARMLCRTMAYDTGTLYSSIRLIWMVGYQGGPEQPFAGEVFDVAVSSEGVDMVAMIKAGGEGYINPKTGWYVDYAQAVHDGTRYMIARPFLTMAIDMNEAYLSEILQRNTDMALRSWEREY